MGGRQGALRHSGGPDVIICHQIIRWPSRLHGGEVCIDCREAEGLTAPPKKRKEEENKSNNNKSITPPRAIKADSLLQCSATRHSAHWPDTHPDTRARLLAPPASRYVSKPVSRYVSNIISLVDLIDREIDNCTDFDFCARPRPHASETPNRGTRVQIVHIPQQHAVSCRSELRPHTSNAGARSRSL